MKESWRYEHIHGQKSAVATYMIPASKAIEHILEEVHHRSCFVELITLESVEKSILQIFETRVEFIEENVNQRRDEDGAYQNRFSIFFDTYDST